MIRRDFLNAFGVLSGAVAISGLLGDSPDSIVEADPEAIQRSEKAEDPEQYNVRTKEADGTELSLYGEPINPESKKAYEERKATRMKLHAALHASEQKNKQVREKNQEAGKQETTILKSTGMVTLGLTAANLIFGKDPKDPFKTQLATQEKRINELTERIKSLSDGFEDQKLMNNHWLTLYNFLTGNYAIKDLSLIVSNRNHTFPVSDMVSHNGCYKGLEIKLNVPHHKDIPNSEPITISLLIARSTENNQLYIGPTLFGLFDEKRMIKVREVPDQVINELKQVGFSDEDFAKIRDLLQDCEFEPTPAFKQMGVSDSTEGKSGEGEPGDSDWDEDFVPFNSDDSIPVIDPTAHSIEESHPLFKPVESRMTMPQALRAIWEKNNAEEVVAHLKSFVDKNDINTYQPGLASLYHDVKSCLQQKGLRDFPQQTDPNFSHDLRYYWGRFHQGANSERAHDFWSRFVDEMYHLKASESK